MSVQALLVLGLHDGHDAGVVLLEDGHIVYAASEERFSRQKLHWGFPHLSLQNLFETTGVAPSSVGAVAVSGQSRFERDEAMAIALEPHRARTFARVLCRIAHHRPPPGRLLDIGCYTGLFPEMALAAGWDVAAIEPSRWAAREAAARLPGRIVTGFVRDARFPDASFDVVTAWDVIEHLSDPRADLAALSRLLRPGGHLFLSTMDVGAPIVRLLGRLWPWYMPMHRYYFTPRTLARLLGTAGFAMRAVESYPHYTSLRYVCGKLEGGFGPLARVVSRAAHALRVADRTIRVNFGDVVFVVAQRTGA